MKDKSLRLGVVPTAEPPYYFVAYNRDETTRFKKYVELLDEAGLNIWYDEGIDPGNPDYQEVIAIKIRECKKMIVFITNDTLNKSGNQVLKEVHIAGLHSKKIIYIVLDSINPKKILPEFDHWWVDIVYAQSSLKGINESDDDFDKKIVKYVKDDSDIEQNVNKINEVAISTSKKDFLQTEFTDIQICNKDLFIETYLINPEILVGFRFRKKKKNLENFNMHVSFFLTRVKEYLEYVDKTAAENIDSKTIYHLYNAVIVSFSHIVECSLIPMHVSSSLKNYCDELMVAGRSKVIDDNFLDKVINKLREIDKIVIDLCSNVKKIYKLENVDS